MDTTAMFQRDAYDQDGPTRKILDRIADKWTVLIVGRLARRTRRFGDLRREVDGISPKMLTQKLRDLERDGIVTRRVYACVPPKVEYRLTPLGQTLIELLDAIRVWSETHIDMIVAAQHTYDQQPAPEDVAA